MKRILLVLTGGTIGSTVSDSTIKTDASTQLQLMERLTTDYAYVGEFAFHTIQPVELHSENLVPRVWQRIIQAVEDQALAEFDGIIITHGTDTLAFSSAAFSLYWHALNLPVLLVSSDYPLTDNRANGIANFICALEFIRQRQEAGVFVPYQNQHQNMCVHLGTRLATSLPLSSDFISVQHKEYLTFDGHHFKISHPYPPNQPRKCFQLKTNFDKQVLLIWPYPGLNYDGFDLTGTEAVLHGLYHSGTAPVTMNWGDRHSLIPFIQRCQNEGITVYLAPAIKNNDSYQSTKTLLDLGAKFIWNTPLEAAYAKLLIAYGSFSDKSAIDEFLDTELAHEWVGF